MFLLNSEFSEDESSKEVAPLIELFNKEENFKWSVSWSDSLAYPIKHQKTAHRFLLNFETTNLEKLKNFKDLANLNPKILRYLIINIERVYGYKRSINPKKVSAAERKMKKHQEFKSRKQKLNEKLLNRTPVNSLS